MKIGIVAKNRKILAFYKKEIRKNNATYALKKAEVILCIGGDGTYLKAERKFPTIPKLLIKDSKICNKCETKLFEKIITKIIEKKYNIISYNKLETYINKKSTGILSANDVIIRNKELMQAIRFNLYIDNKKLFSQQLIGDGIVVSTVFGSTAYFNSITKTSIKKGIGLAFNNLTIDKKFKNIDKDSKIKLIMQRGKAQVGFDNLKRKKIIRPYDEVLVKVSKEKANLVKFL